MRSTTVGALKLVGAPVVGGDSSPDLDKDGPVMVDISDFIWQGIGDFWDCCPDRF